MNTMAETPVMKHVYRVVVEAAPGAGCDARTHPEVTDRDDAIAAPVSVDGETDAPVAA
jgi:hypothetical protein